MLLNSVIFHGPFDLNILKTRHKVWLSIHLLRAFWISLYSVSSRMFTKMRPYANLDYEELRFICLKSVMTLQNFHLLSLLWWFMEIALWNIDYRKMLSRNQCTCCKEFWAGNLYYPIRFLHSNMSQSTCSIRSRVSAPSSVINNQNGRLFVGAARSKDYCRGHDLIKAPLWLRPHQMVGL